MKVNLKNIYHKNTIFYFQDNITYKIQFPITSYFYNLLRIHNWKRFNIENFENIKFFDMIYYNYIHSVKYKKILSTIERTNSHLLHGFNLHTVISNKSKLYVNMLEYFPKNTLQRLIF